MEARVEEYRTGQSREDMPQRPLSLTPRSLGDILSPQGWPGEFGTAFAFHLKKHVVNVYDMYTAYKRGELRIKIKKEE
jgi:hypothetical protein